MSARPQRYFTFEWLARRPATALLVTIALQVSCAAPAVVPVSARRPAMLPSVLFVRTETALRLGGPDGPIVGRAFAGAHVLVIAERDGWSEIELGFIGAEGTRLHVWAPARAFAIDPVDAPRPAARDARVTQDRAVELSVAPGQPAFVRTACDALYVMEEAAGLRVIQRSGGIELEGWARDLGGSATCGQSAAREQEPLPPGWVRTDAAVARAAIRLRLSAGGRVWQRGRRTEGLCTEWNVEPAAAPTDARRALLRGRLVRWAQRRRQWIEITRAFALDGDRFFLGVPHGSLHRDRDGPLVDHVAVCADDLGQRRVIVGGDELRWLFAYREAALSAYRPEDAERWYATREACESELAGREAERREGCPGDP